MVPEEHLGRYEQHVGDAARFLSAGLATCPQIGVLTGTGLGDSFADLAPDLSLAYGQIPHFPESTVAGHRGRLTVGRLAGRCLAVLQGRVHLYEGYTPRQVVFPIRVLREMGVSTLVVTNAAGGLAPHMACGDVMAIRDHINLTGTNPLVGATHDRWGPRFPDMSRPYDPELIELAQAAAQRAGLSLQRGVYAGLLGPCLETPAEIRFLRTIGADAVGLSTVQEVIAAVHGGMRVLGVSVITNRQDPDHPAPARLAEIIATAERAAPRVGRILSEVIGRL